MPLQLIAPGKRVKIRNGQQYTNPFYLVRGEVGGRNIEVSTKTRDKAAAERFKATFELRLLDGRVPQPGEEMTFAQAAEFYSAWRQPRKLDQTCINKIVGVLGKRLIRELRHADLVKAANFLHPLETAATKNRHVLGPAAAILHYAANNEWCDWLRVKLFKERKPVARAVSKDIARVLIANAPGPEEELLLLWLFNMGTRITDTLHVENERINLPRRTVEMHVSKGDDWPTFALDEEVFEAIANFTPCGPKYLFRWRTRFGVYKWLRPLCRKLGIRFTPHMGRHSMATWLNEAGANLRTIQVAGAWKSQKSVIRYTDTGIEQVRAAKQRVGKLMGETPEEGGKS